MSNNTAVNFLELAAIRIDSNTRVATPNSSKEETLDVDGLKSRFNKHFSVRALTVCIVLGDAVYAAPYTRKLVRELEKLGFVEKSFGVPFCDETRPVTHQKVWNGLLDQAHESYAIDFVNDCDSHCDSHNIGKIDSEILEACFEMPFSGVTVERFGKKDCYHPIVHPLYDFDTVKKLIGHFYYGDNKVVFCYRDGKTYVAKGYGILKVLVNAGYVAFNQDLPVPFSDENEVILNPTLKARWISTIEIC